MFKFLLNLLSPYAHPFEKKADKFFKKIKSTSNPFAVQKKLEKLMQEDLVILDLWMEKKYKNYKYLNKGTRRRMYENVELLNKDFDQYVAKRAVQSARIKEEIEKHGLTFPVKHAEKLEYLSKIMSYLSPSNHFHYEASANFGKLLRNPKEEKLIGDCNQIVTLYAYLYSRKFPISNLKIKILPKHVCLHFEGIDIEATNATFHHYKDFEYLLPITELIPTNALDTTDSTEQTEHIDPRTMVKRAQFAQATSSMREVVDRNLQAAYRHAGVTMMNNKEYDSAIFFFEKLGDPALLGKVHHNAAVHYLNSKNLRKASYYANQSGNADLKNAVIRAQGVKYYNQKNYTKAKDYFKKAGEEKMVKACYQGMYSQLAKKVKVVKTVQDARKFRSTYQKMLDLAHKMGNEQAVSYVRGVLGKM